MSVSVITKQPAELLRHELFNGLAIASIDSVSAVARGLIAGAVAIVADAAIGAAGRGVVVSFSSGADGERYLVTVRASLADGDVREAEAEVVVLDAQWTMPDGGVGYLTISEFVGMFTLEEAVRMTDADGSGRIDRSYLIGALRAAQGIANGNLATRYAVPIATVPDLVKTAIADIARARLYPRGAPEGVAGAAKDAVRMLERIASGALPLPLPAGETAAAAESDAPVLISPGERRYPKGRSASW